MIVFSTAFAATINSIVMLAPHQSAAVILPKKTIIQVQQHVETQKTLSESKSIQAKESPSTRSTSTITAKNANTESPDLVLLSITYSPMRISYIMMWVATIITILPLVCYLSGNIYSDYIGLTNQTQKANLLYDTLFIVSSITAGGILFGSAFLTVANSIAGISNVNAVRNYLTATAYGIVLLAISLTSPIVYMPYPPFAATAWSFVALASYLFSLGFFSSAISISHDSNLRKLLRTSIVEQQAKFLDNIGTAEMQKELEDRILDLTNKESVRMLEQTGIQPSLSEDDVKEYLGQVLNEMDIIKRRTKSDGTMT